jgi:hypothetical protein
MLVRVISRFDDRPAPSSPARHAHRRNRPARLPRASTAGPRSARTAGPSTRTGCRRTPARTLRSRSHPTRGQGRGARRPGQRPAGGVPTPPYGSAQRRKTRPRSARARARGPVPVPDRIAAPARSPGPASPPSIPAHRTQTATRSAHDLLPGRGPCAGPTQPAHPRPVPEPHIPGDAGSSAYRSHANAAVAGPARPGPNVAGITPDRAWRAPTPTGIACRSWRTLMQERKRMPAWGG